LLPFGTLADIEADVKANIEVLGAAAVTCARPRTLSNPTRRRKT